MKKIAFLDRDGTINRDYPDEQWRNVNHPEFLPGAIDGMKKLLESGYEIIIVTNQYIIHDGIITMEDYSEYTEKFLTELSQNGIEILHIYFCPHNDAEECHCKKPKPGMIEQALLDYEIDLSASIYCGDSEVDYLLAKQFELPFYGINYAGAQNDVIYCVSLLEACTKASLA